MCTTWRCLCAAAFLAYSFPTLSDSRRLQIRVIDSAGNQVTSMLLRRKNSYHSGAGTQATGRIYSQLFSVSTCRLIISSSDTFYFSIQVKREMSPSCSLLLRSEREKKKKKREPSNPGQAPTYPAVPKKQPQLPAALTSGLTWRRAEPGPTPGPAVCECVCV